MAHRIFGHMPDGTPILEYTLKSERLTVSVLSFGGILRTLTVNGRDVIGGFDSFSAYLIDDDPYQGAIIGRGTHEELSRPDEGGCAVYREIAESQMGGAILE
jgi:hypothetical protein